MSESILVALITGGMSLAGVVATCLATARKNENALKISQAITETKLDELAREVREHNGFAKRMPVVENQIETIQAVLTELKNYHK